MIRFYHKLVNNGVQPSKTSWENELAKKVNLATVVSILYMFIATVFVYIMHYDAFFYECLFATILLFGVLVVNRKNVIMAIYAYYVLDFLFLIPVNLKMGIDSYIIVYFFPLMFTLIQLLGKKETIKHLVILSVLCLITVIFILIGFKFHWLRIGNSTSSFALIVFNIILSITSSTLFALLISFESIKQQAFIKKILHEKEILLSEVLHRVKNNMNIITSLLNLKKMSAKEEETILALEDCKNRVYSMALVHENIYSSEKPLIIQIELKKREESIYMRIKDNGPGISDELLHSSNSFGLDLIQGLSEQINGEMKITSVNGFQYELSFN